MYQWPHVRTGAVVEQKALIAAIMDESIFTVYRRQPIALLNFLDLDNSLHPSTCSSRLVAFCEYFKVLGYFRHQDIAVQPPTAHGTT